MAGVLSGLFRYGESELDPAVQSEILLETARSEARVAILEIVLALLFGVWLDFFRDEAFRWVALFCLGTVLFLLIDAQARRSAAKRLVGSPYQVLPAKAPPGQPKRR